MKLFAIIIFFSLLGALFFSPEGRTQSAAKIKSHDERIREEMVVISRQLSVTCTECHRVDNFKDDKKASFQKAKEHMEIVQLLKSKGFDGKQGPLASCFMCHQGALKPAYKENLKVLTIKKESPAETK